MKWILLTVAVCVLAGCKPHIKAFDSHGTLFSNVKPTGYYDPFNNGGIADATGGTIIEQDHERMPTEGPNAVEGSNAPIDGNYKVQPEVPESEVRL